MLGNKEIHFEGLKDYNKRPTPFLIRVLRIID